MVSEAIDAISRLMVEMRPRLHRYCARMVGSSIDGEDAVQEALANAAAAVSGGAAIERPENWLFRIAHNAAIDLLRRRRSNLESGDSALSADLPAPDGGADTRVEASASLSAFLHLPAGQRSAVILVDVLGHSIAETAGILDMTLAAVKAALHRGRASLRVLASSGDAAPPARLAPAEKARLQAYADRFNARDFDALRALLAEDVQLDLVNRTRLDGRGDVSVYFTRYDSVADWWLSPGLADGRPALLVSNPADGSAVRYVVLLSWHGGKIAAIRDFHYAAYATADMVIERE